jgi:hypothetical protein
MLSIWRYTAFMDRCVWWSFLALGCRRSGKCDHLITVGGTQDRPLLVPEWLQNSASLQRLKQTHLMNYP